MTQAHLDMNNVFQAKARLDASEKIVEARVEQAEAQGHVLTITQCKKAFKEVNDRHKASLDLIEAIVTVNMHLFTQMSNYLKK